MRIENRTFLVSGGSSGLGLATVINLLDAGAHISLLDLKPPSSDIPLSSDENKLKFIKTDITNLAEIERAVEQTVQWAKATGAKLGGVVNCAGVGVAGKIIDAHGQPHSLDLWDFTLAVNLTGTFNLTRLALKHLINVSPDSDDPDAERGVIIFVASLAAFEGQIGQVAYAASKGALVGMTLPLARDLARHAIRVATIAPGAFASAMTAGMPRKTHASLEREILHPRRLGRPDEFASTVRWILECAYVNGECIRVSGGLRLPARM